MMQYKALPAVPLLAVALTACAFHHAPKPAPAQAPVAAAMASDADTGPAVESLTEARNLQGGGLIREDAPLRYVVKKGDTLWGIASKYLADPYNWPEVWYVNGKIANPHRIYPGDVLELHNVKGRLRVAKSGALERVGPQIRSDALEDAIPAIPIDAIRNFLKGPRLVDAETLNSAPYVLAFLDEHLMGGANIGAYVKNLRPEGGSSYQLVRKGDTYRDPDNGDILGYEALPTGDAEVRDFGKASTINIAQSVREVLTGDRLLPPEAENFQAYFYPHAPKGAIGGHIISVYDALNSITQYQIVTMNRGSKHGLDAGTVLSVFQPERLVKDPVTGKNEVVPALKAGTLMVFKVMPRLSYGLIMSATRPIHVQDAVEKPNPANGQ